MEFGLRSRPSALRRRCRVVRFRTWTPVTTLSRAQARRIALAAQGFLDPRHTTPTMRTVARTLAAHRRAPGRLGQRAPAGPLHAAVLADGPLRPGAAHPGVGAEAPAAGRVLGARAGADAGRAVAGDAAPDGVLPRPAGQVVAGRRRRRRRAAARRDRRARAEHRPRARRRCATRQEALGLELVRGQEGPRLPLHVRRAGRGGAQQPVRGDLRRAGARDPGRRACPAHAQQGRGGPRAGPPRSGLPRRRHAPLPGRLLPDARPTT